MPIKQNKMNHVLEVSTSDFKEFVDGDKQFAICNRKEDYKVGDLIEISEVVSIASKYSGESIKMKITSMEEVLCSDHVALGLDEQFKNPVLSGILGILAFVEIVLAIGLFIAKVWIKADWVGLMLWADLIAFIFCAVLYLLCCHE